MFSKHLFTDTHTHTHTHPPEKVALLCTLISRAWTWGLFLSNTMWVEVTVCEFRVKAFRNIAHFCWPSGSIQLLSREMLVSASYCPSSLKTGLPPNNLQVHAATAAAAKSLQSCPTLCDPIDGSPPGSPVPGILQARTLEWVAISFYNAWKWKVKVKSLSCVQLLVTPWTTAHQAPPSMGFSSQE